MIVTPSSAGNQLLDAQATKTIDLPPSLNRAGSPPRVETHIPPLAAWAGTPRAPARQRAARWACGLTSLLWLALAAAPLKAQTTSIELSALSQSLAQIGSSIELSVTGTAVDELRQLHFSYPLVSSPTNAALADPSATQVLDKPPSAASSFKTLIDPAADPGRCEVRAVGRFGISNPRPLWLTHKPVVVAGADHTDAALAIDYPIDSIVVARCVPQRRNYYRCAIQPGQTLTAVAYAKQLDSRASPILVLYGPAPQRRELSRGRGVGNWPAQVSASIDEPGDALLVVYDAIYGGGIDYPYALECVISTSPQPEATASAATLELDHTMRPSLHSPPQAVADIERWSVASQLLASATAESAETLPVSIEGISTDDRAVNSHDFTASKGQVLWLEVASQRLGQLTDMRLLLHRVTSTADSGDGSPLGESLQQILEFDDPPVLGDAGLKVQSRDPQLNWSVPEDGRYRIELFDNESGQRLPEQCRYQLRVQPSQPAVQLLAYPPFPTNNPALSRPAGVNLMRGGTCAIRVLALRRGGSGAPIEIEASGLPEGVSCAPVVIHPTQTEATLTLQASESAAAWVGPLQIVGRASTDELGSVEAQPATIMWPVSATRNAVQSRLCDGLILSVNIDDTAPLTTLLGDGSTLEVKQGEKLAIPIALTRRAGGAAACVLRPQNLLAKTSLAEVTIAADQAQGVAELTVAADAPLGEFTCWLQCETKIKWRDNPQAFARAEAQLQNLTTELTQAADTTDTAEKQKLQTAVDAATARVAELKLSTAEKEVTVWLPSTTQRIRVIAP